MAAYIRGSFGSTPQDGLETLRRISRLPPPGLLRRTNRLVIVYGKPAGEERIRSKQKIYNIMLAWRNMFRCFWLAAEAVAAGMSDTCFEADIMMREVGKLFDHIPARFPRAFGQDVHETVTRLTTEVVHLLEVRRFELFL